MNNAPEVIARRLAYEILGFAQFESPRDVALHPGCALHSVWRKHDDTNFLFFFSFSTCD
jgi:hypothetical protein